VEFDFEVAQDAEAQPVASTLSVRYRRAGGKNEIVDSKPIGIVVSGSVDLRIIDKTPKPSDGEIEVDIANYGNKDADAVRVEALANGIVFGTGFTDQIKANKHKVFRFDMPSESQVLVRISYKDYGEASGTKTVEEPITLNVKEVVSGGSSPVPGILLFVAVLVVLFWYLRRRKRNGIKIDVSKYKDG
jgi:hypothetical protein